MKILKTTKEERAKSGRGRQIVIADKDGTAITWHGAIAIANNHSDLIATDNSIGIVVDDALGMGYKNSVVIVYPGSSAATQRDGVLVFMRDQDPPVIAIGGKEIDSGIYYTLNPATGAIEKSKHPQLPY